MNILVIGGAGFLGRRIVSVLVGQGHEVVCMDITGTSAFASLGKQVTVLRGDVTRFEDVVSATISSKPAIVINLSYGIGSDFAPRPAMKLNILGMDNCFEAARLADVQHVVFSSSIAVYGGGCGGQRNYGYRNVLESDSTMADKQYSVHKVFNEWQAKEYREKHGMRITAIRASNVAGVDKAYGSVDHVRCIVGPAIGEEVTFKFRDRMRSCIYVDDVAEIFSRIALCTSPEHHIYNTGGEALSLGQIADVVRKYIPDARIHFEHASGGEAEIGASAYMLSNARFVQEFGYAIPPYEQRIEQMIQLARAQAGWRVGSN